MKLSCIIFFFFKIEYFIPLTFILFFIFPFKNFKNANRLLFVPINFTRELWMILLLTCDRIYALRIRNVCMMSFQRIGCCATWLLGQVIWIIRGLFAIKWGIVGFIRFWKSTSINICQDVINFVPLTHWILKVSNKEVSRFERWVS